MHRRLHCCAMMRMLAQQILVPIMRASTYHPFHARHQMLARPTHAMHPLEAAMWHPLLAMTRILAQSIRATL